MAENDPMESRSRILDLDALGKVPVGVEADKQLDSIEKSLTPGSKAQRQLMSVMRPYLELGVDVIQSVNFATKQVAAVVAKFNQEFAPVISVIAKALENYPERMRGNLLVLAKEGWYIDPEWDLPVSFQLENDISSGSRSEAVNWIASSFRERLDAIEADLCQFHSLRASILRKAFAAHRAEDFELSVPVFLSQADGIAFDLHERELYSRHKDRGLLGKELAGDVFATPLVVSTPLNATSREREPGFCGLNRHLVLHGQDLNYATEENSLKSLSLLNYTSFALRSLKK